MLKISKILPSLRSPQNLAGCYSEKVSKNGNKSASFPQKRQFLRMNLQGNIFAVEGKTMPNKYFYEIGINLGFFLPQMPIFAQYCSFGERKREGKPSPK